MLVEIAPGDVIDFFITAEMEAYLTDEDIYNMRERLGLNDPVPVRYLKWLGRVVQGDLGYSFVDGKSVLEIIGVRLKNTLILMGAALSLAVIVGIILGVFTALRQYSFWDFTLSGLSFVGISLPAFIAGIIGLYIFAVKLGWFPAGGMYTAGSERTIPDLLYHLILPASTLAILHLATNMRYTRFSMLEVINQDYIITAKAKGLRERLITYRHAFRNAMLPVITIIGLSIPGLVVGAVFLETIYSWPGMGTLYLIAVSGRDYPVIMGVNLIFALIVLLANLGTDIVYSLIDPRVRFED
jgi:peptide/nickel transport system permease protein